MKLHSNMSDDQYLDAISAPSSGRGLKKKSHKRQDTIDISDESDDDVEKKPIKADADTAMDTAP